MEVAQVLGFPWESKSCQIQILLPFQTLFRLCKVGVGLGFLLNSNLLVVVRALV